MNKARIVIWRRHRVALATKGVQLDELVYDANDVEVGGGAPHLGARDGEGAHTPMLGAEYGPVLGYDDARGQRHSYATPYDIAYDRAAGMSVYRVEGADGVEGALEDRLEVERRVEARLSAFPVPQPSGGAGVHRAPSAVSTYAPADPGAAGSASFPVAHPQTSQAPHEYATQPAYSAAYPPPSNAAPGGHV